MMNLLTVFARIYAVTDSGLNILDKVKIAEEIRDGGHTLTEVDGAV
jgi:hypothetical protein